ncbi:SpaA isopeptide-forming pilin-related protein [Enterococcus malodoratus]|uniref:SpaA isopeptide-forming pilin-related protein n=1 Tax=Enterococcus malodoratus TaxID=71451 RepID=UPI0020749ABA|nr:SpaA isopeptide-forming pilin-related protein [Enterococcus malodoratus]
MKRWVSTVMLLSLLGSFAAPIVATAVETTESTASGASESTTINSLSSDPQQTVPTESAPIPEKSEDTKESVEIKNSLQFDKTSEFVDKDLSKDQTELNLVGTVNSSVENNQPVIFEMTKSFTVKDNKADEKIILNETNETIGKYTVDATGERTKYTLNFNKLVKGDTRFKLNLLGTITRGPDQTVDFYQADQKLFQLAVPKLKESEESSSISESETTATTDSAKSSTTDNSKKTTETSKENEPTKKKNTIKAKANEQKARRAAGPIDDLFTQFAPGDNFVSDSSLDFDPDPPTINSVIDFKLNFVIPESVRTEMVPGDYYEMDFPQGLAIGTPSPSGNLTDNDGTIYGTYIFDATTQKLRITFTQQDGKDFLPPENGSVTADVHFDTKKIMQPGQTSIVYPTKTNIPPLTIKIKPTVGSSISKAGHTDTPNNPNKVIWNVDFNKDFSELTNPLLTEHFPDQVTFNKEETGAVTIYPLNVDFNGNVIDTGQTPIDPSTYTVADDGSIQFNTPLDSPYRVVYSTTIKDTAKPIDGGTVPITNKADLTAGTINLSASATVQLNYKKALEKVRTGYDSVGQEYSWLIRYNYGQKELADDKVISDTYSTNMDVEADSFNIYTVNFDSNGNPVNGAPINPNNYTIDTSTNPFNVTFKNNVQAGKAINIAYKTKVNKIVSGSSTNQVAVTNQAKTNNLPPTQPITSTPIQQVVIKNKPAVDVGTKIAHYTIDLNKNKYQMDNALFTDTMSNTEHNYTSVPSKIKMPSADEDAGVVIRDVSANDRILIGTVQLVEANGDITGTIGNPATSDYILSVNLTPDRSGYTNFTVKFQNAYAQTNHQFKMEYYIGYNQFSQNKPNPNTSIDYKNTMVANFTNNGNPYSSSSSTDFKTSTQEVNQGMKSGSYDPKTKEITWTIIANYNNLGVSVFGFKDPITGNQVYEPDSLTVTRGSINANGNFQATTDTNYSGNQVGKDYLKVTNPQPIGENAQGTLEMGIGSDSNYIPGWDTGGTPMVFHIQFKTSLRGKLVYDQSTYTNTAITTVEGIEQRLSASVSIAFGGKSAVKTGNYNTQTGFINWQLDINPNQSLLSNVKIQDTPSSNQILQESFKLYTGKYAGSGNSTTVQPDQLVPSDQYKVNVTTDPATGQQSFTVDMSAIKEKPDPNNAGQYLTGVIEKPYVLVYDTEPNFTAKTETVTNSASISSEGRELPGKDTQKNIAVTIQDSSGTAFGTKGKITVQKVDGNGSIVSGAVLELLRKNIKTNKTDVLYKTTTDSQGLATFGNLIATSSTYEYYVKEIEAPDGYTISPDLLAGKKVSVSTSNDTPITQIENEPVKVIFHKTDRNGQPLEGGFFNLYQNNGTADAPNYILLRAFVSKKEGVDLSGLGDGQYRIREVLAPKIYQINLTPIDFEIKRNADHSRNVFVNDEVVSDGKLQLKDYQGSAMLKKSDESGKSLAGAKFNLQRAEYNTNDYYDYGIQDSYVTDSKGQLNLTELPPGKYKLKESQAPEGYYLNSREFTFAVEPVTTGDQEPATIQLNDGDLLIDYQGSARFKKVDGHDYNKGKDTPLAGARFQLYKADGKTTVGDPVTSRSDGYFTFENLTPGTSYAIKEIQAPNDYLTNQQLVRFTTPVSNNQEGSSVTIDDASQKLVIDEQTPFENYKEGVRFQKLDAKGHGLGDAKYQLFMQQNDQWQPVTNVDNGAGSDGLFTSDELSGNVQAFELSPGSYKFVEAQAPQGYLLNTKEIPFKVQEQAESDPPVLDIPITEDANVNYQGSAQLTKTDGAGKALQDAKFKIIDDQGKDVAGKTATSDEKGLVRVTGLAPGNYRFVETEAPDKGKDGKYIMTGENLAFRIPAENNGEPATVKIKDTVANYRGAIRLHKVGNDLSDNSKEVDLAGAEFTFYTKADFSDSNPMKVTSNAKGNVSFADLAPGTYYVKETKAPNGYLVNTFPLKFVIPDRVPATMPMTDGQNHSNKIEDGTYIVDAGDFQNARKEIELKKTDGESKEIGNLDLSQVKFALYLDDGSTDAKLIKYDLSPETIGGAIDLSNLALEDGSYKLVETQTSPNYVLSNQPIYFVVNNQQAIGMTFDLANYQASIKGRKVSGDKELAGAEYELFKSGDLNQSIETTDKDGEKQTTIKTGNDGEFFAKGLSAGDYILKETKAPKGYILDTTEHKFTIYPQNGKPATLDLGDFENYQGSVELTKVDTDNSNKRLANAEFQLFDSNQKVIHDQLKTNADGKLEVTDLAPGKYHFKETKAPAGYRLSEKTIDFTVSAKSNGKPRLLEVTAKNKRVPNQPTEPNKPSRPNTPSQGFYPKTGEAKGLTLLVIGVIIVLIVGGIVYIRRRK